MLSYALPTRHIPQDSIAESPSFADGNFSPNLQNLWGIDEAGAFALNSQMIRQHKERNSSLGGFYQHQHPEMRIGHSYSQQQRHLQHQQQNQVMSSSIHNNNNIPNNFNAVATAAAFMANNEEFFLSSLERRCRNVALKLEQNHQQQIHHLDYQSGHHNRNVHGSQHNPIHFYHGAPHLRDINLAMIDNDEDLYADETGNEKDEIDVKNPMHLIFDPTRAEDLTHPSTTILSKIPQHENNKISRNSQYSSMSYEPEHNANGRTDGDLSEKRANGNKT